MSTDPQQQLLDLELPQMMRGSDYVVTNANSEAVTTVSQYSDWNTPFCLLVGPSGSGKTHLAQVWQDVVNAEKLEGNLLFVGDTSQNYLIDNLNDFLSATETNKGESALFHLYNQQLQDGGLTLIVVDEGVDLNGLINLEDLKSRLVRSTQARLYDPDETTVETLLTKKFNDFQIAVAPSVIKFIAPRLPRDYADVIAAAEKLNAAALKQQRSITIPFSKETLGL